jgi:hypothetical protein
MAGARACKRVGAPMRVSACACAQTWAEAMMMAKERERERARARVRVSPEAQIWARASTCLITRV